ncbi:MAG: hypothetical protein PHS82_13285 [Lachnospiraceae bacterium]|nr:hypothetical protein [Lachnospiraceae bacterium]
MRSKLMTLLKIQYMNQSSLNALRYETDRRKRNRTIAVYVSMALVILMMMAYSFLMAYGYGFLGMSNAVPGFALVISSVVTLFFTFIKSNGFLFAFKDYDMLMALPFTTGTVITAKFLYMYINNLLFSLCVMVPMGVGYAMWVHPSAITYVIWLVIAVATPLLPMSVAALAGGLIAAVGSRFRFKVLAQVILSLIGVMAIFGLSFSLNGAGSNGEFFRRIGDIGKVMETQIHRWYPVSIWTDAAVNEKSILALLGFLLVSVGVYGVFVAVTSIKYKTINTALMSHHAASNYKMRKQESHSAIHALVRKEVKRFTSSVPYLMNMGIGAILAVIGSVVCVIIGPEKLLASMEINVIPKQITYIVPFAVGMFLTMTCTTCVSLSLEGKNLWIVKSLPLDTRTIFKSKMIFNMLLVAPAGIISSLCFAFVLKVDVATLLIYILLTLVSVGFSTTFGMWAGIRFAKFDWENEIEVIKQGAASMLGIFVNMILQIILAVAVGALSLICDGRILMVIVVVLLGVVDWLIYGRIMKIQMRDVL